MTIHNIGVRISDGNNFGNTISKKRWCIHLASAMGIHFKKIVESLTEEDTIRLWFLKTGSKGIASYVATFDGLVTRELGPLLCLTPTSEEYGWGAEGDKYDTEVAYTDLYNIEKSGVDTSYKGRSSWGRISNAPENLDEVYSDIVRYSKSISM